MPYWATGRIPPSYPRWSRRIFLLDRVGSVTITRPIRRSTGGRLLAKAFVRTLGVFCGLLGIIYGSIKVLSAPPKLLFLVPALSLLFLGGSLLMSSSGRAKPPTGDGK
jgi:hypothetical protein